MSGSGSVLWINIVLIGVCLSLFFYYIAAANSITDKNYKILELRVKLDNLTETSGVLAAERLSLESIAVLRSLAGSLDLVEAKDVSYIFENKNLAQK